MALTMAKENVKLSTEQARISVRRLSSGTSSTDTPLEKVTTDQFAFAFDIDGVLVRGGEAIPAAIEAMKVLNGENEYGIKVPYIFVTNGGGKTEAERCRDLSRQLSVEVCPGQFICGHTPMRELVGQYETVLVVGGEGEKCRQVAEGYGFRDVVTPGDIIKDNEHTTPFRKLTAEERRLSRERNFGEHPIDAILVFADSRDWAGDQQIILDLLLSEHGRLGTRSATGDQGPPLFFSHDDMVWATSHDLTRLGMGALRASTAAMYAALTGGKTMPATSFGKPQRETFAFAGRLLDQWRRDAHGLSARAPATVYFIGDTPESDIRGANDFNAVDPTRDWHSVLVRTGVYRAGTTPTYQPRTIVDDALAAVHYAMHRELGPRITAAPVLLPLPATTTTTKMGMLDTEQQQSETLVVA